jgi:hypothetical protein
MQDWYLWIATDGTFRWASADRAEDPSFNWNYDGNAIAYRESPDGTAVFPAYTYALDNDTGQFRVGANNEGFSAGGILRWDYNTIRMKLSPGYILDFGGYTQISATPLALTINTDLVVDGDISFTGNLTFSDEFLGLDGTALNPAYSFASAPNTGMYLVASSVLGFSAAAELRLSASSTEVTTFVPLNAFSLSVQNAANFLSDVNVAGAIAGSSSISASGIVSSTTGLAAPWLDLPEGVIPPDPLVNTARLYSIDVNGYTQVEIVDGASKAVRLASDNVLVAKVSGVSVTRGQAIYISGANGANPLASLARADSLSTLPCVGIAMDNGNANAFIRVLLGGTLQLLNTSAFSEGDRLFVSPTTAGNMTTTIPVAPNYAQRVGIVTRAHATQGEMIVLTTSIDGPPRVHATAHEVGGGDQITGAMAVSSITAPSATFGSLNTTPINPANISGTIPNTKLSVDVLRYTGGYPGGTVNYLRADGTFSPVVATPGPHHATHEPGGADALALTAASRLFGRGDSGAGAVQEITLGAGMLMTGTVLSSPVASTTFRTSFTWSLVGDLTSLNNTFIPGPYIPLTGTQTARIVGIRGRIHTGTSVGFTLYRTDVASGTYTITPTRTTTAVNIPITNEDEMLINITSTVGSPTNLNVSLIVEITP